MKMFYKFSHSSQDTRNSRNLCLWKHRGRASITYEESDDEVEGKVVEATRKKKTKLSDFFQMYTKALTEIIYNRLERITAELSRYKGEPTIHIDEKPLLWWNERESQYPSLSNLAKWYFCIPATSVCSEEIFCAAGNVFTEKRNRLLPENLDNLVFFTWKSLNQMTLHYTLYNHTSTSILQFFYFLCNSDDKFL